MNPFRPPISFLLLAFLVMFSSCEREQEGILDTDLTTPFIEASQLDHGSLDLDTTSGAAVTRRADGSYLVSVALSAQVRNATGIQNVQGVFYRIYRPGESRYFKSGRLSMHTPSSSTAAEFAADLSFVLERSEAGSYRVELFALNAANGASNYLQLPLRITRNNSVPRLLAAVVPDSIFLPPGDSLLIRLTVAVSDSDGAGDISGVFFYSLNSSDPTRQFFLSDDGNIGGFSGDLLAGDGTYTITVKLLDQGNVRRTFQFEFHAFDLQGSDSGPLRKPLTVY